MALHEEVSLRSRKGDEMERPAEVGSAHSSMRQTHIKGADIRAIRRSKNYAKR